MNPPATAFCPRKSPAHNRRPPASSLLWRCLAGCVVAAGCLGAALGATVDLVPVPEGDGAYAQVTVAGEPVWQNTGASIYLYCRRPDSFTFTPGQALYVRVTYYDDEGGGTIGLQYDAQAGAYTSSTVHARTSRVGAEQFVDGFFELPGVFFGRRQNGGTDFRLICGAPGGVNMSVRRITLSDTPFADGNFQLAISRPWQTRYTGPAKDYVDAATLKGKVMAGYQGWFRTPNDLYDDGWSHWARNNTMTPENFTVDMWPALTEYDPATLARAGSVMTRGGAPAYLFSSTSYPVVQKHFRWMRKHNIDGAFVQRFHPRAGAVPEWVLRNVSQAAAEQGLIWAVEYDVSGMSDSTVVAQLQADWQWLTTQFGILQDPRYAREGGRPVVFIWGFPFTDRGFTSANANAAVDYFKGQGAYVIGGIPNNWTSLNTAWQTHLAKYHGILVWQNQSTSNAAFFRGRGQDFYPHIWPGFSWANLQRLPATPLTQYTDRAGGQFYWTKGRDWINGGGADRLFIGMFDEYDEATAIMPMSDDPPNPSAAYGRFIDNQSRPGDWWMMLTDELKRMMFQQRTNTNTLPTLASLSNRSNIGPEASVDLGATDLTSSLFHVQDPDGNTFAETVGGRECRANTTPAIDRYMYFNVDNAFAHQLASGDVTVEVEYYDANTSTVLGLQYDSDTSAYTTHPQSITTTGGNTWRTVRFEIADAFFGGRQNAGADFRLTLDGKKLNVNRVWVRLPEGKYFPFTWTNAATGAALNWSQNANWLGGIVAQSDLSSDVRVFPGQTLPGGSISISNNLAGQQFGALRLGGAASPGGAATVTLSGNAFSLGGAAPAIALDATRSGSGFTYDIAAPVTLLGATQVSGNGDATFRISGAISGSGGLVKTGAAALTLTGAATHLGATAVNGGALFVNGSFGGSALTVAGTAALAGTGTISTATTIQGQHRPGALAGTQTFTGSLTYAAGSRLRWDLIANTTAAPGASYDRVAAANVTVAAGAALDIVLNSGIAVNFTDPFWLLPQTWTVLTVSSPPTGLFTLGTVSADSAGRAAASYGAFSVAQTTGAVNILWTPVVNFNTWQAQKFGAAAGNPAIAGELADPDREGIQNLMEYALGLNPMTPDAADLPTVEASGGFLKFIYSRPSAITDLTYQVEWTGNLAAWSTAGVIEDLLTDDGATRTIRAKVPVSGMRQFLHLKVTRN